MLLLPGLEQAQTLPHSFPIEKTQVVEALTKAGLPVSVEDIAAMPLTSSLAAPALKVLNAEARGDDRILVRMACAQPAACLSFFVSVTLRPPYPAQAAELALRSSFSPSQPTKTVGDSTVHAGSRAVLLLEDAHMHIKLPVICIDTGKVGTEVRVSSLDHKQIYRGVVSDADSVRGTLP